MKIIGSAILALAALSSAASAATTITATPDFAAPAGSTAIMTFNNPAGTAAEANPLGLDVDFVPLSRRIDNTEIVNHNGNEYLFLKPGFTDGSGFFAVGGRGAGVTFTTRGVGMSSISLFAGSIDNYNQIDLLALDGVTVLRTVTGIEMYGTNAPFPGTDGDRQANKRLTFTGTDGTVYGGIRLYNTGDLGSFEFDQLAFTAAPVPEPATWAMMIAGFGLVGFAARRRNSLTTITA